MISCKEIFNSGGEYDPSIGQSKETFGLREVFINPKYIVMMKENEVLYIKAQRKNLIKGLNKNLRFTQISLNTPGQSPQLLSVVGAPSEISEVISGKDN